MARVAYVYVGKAAGGNWGIGVTQGIWGWETSVLDRADSRAIAGSLREGDLFFMARGGPTPRTQPGGWRDARLAEVWIAVVTKELYESATVVWPDKPYPHRIGLTGLTSLTDVTAEGLGDASALEHLRMSANKQGAPILGNLDVPDEQPAADGLESPPNRLATVVVRAEQAKIRSLKFGTSAELTCDMCGRAFPKRLVRAAHIKRRSHLDPGEHMNLGNIMAACAFGCDEMFEHGYIYVDSTGAIRTDNRVTPGSSLEEFFAERLAEHVCAAYSDASATFFAYHRVHFARIDQVTMPEYVDISRSDD